MRAVCEARHSSSCCFNTLFSEDNLSFRLFSVTISSSIAETEFSNSSILAFLRSLDVCAATRFLSFFLYIFSSMVRCARRLFRLGAATGSTIGRAMSMSMGIPRPPSPPADAGTVMMIACEATIFTDFSALGTLTGRTTGRVGNAEQNYTRMPACSSPLLRLECILFHFTAVSSWAGLMQQIGRAHV